jgi:myo-inositol 2-dehydrogenase / D-chiro-inositol 1-dehydrogenase
MKGISMPDTNANSLTRRGFLKTSAAAAVVASTFAVPAVHAAGSDKISIGLIGCGGRGRGAIADIMAVDANDKPLNANVQVTAIADLFPDAIEETMTKIWAEKPKATHDIPKERQFVGLDAYKQLLATDVSYVVLATPPGFRPLMIKAAIEAGKHVFAEKPVAVCPTGVRMVMAAGEEAAKKNLGLVIGTQRRHARDYMETIKRIHDGAIGKVIAGQVYWTQGGAWVKPRQPAWSDLEWQLRNWPYFTWLGGDHIVEQHMHQHDVMNWVMSEKPDEPTHPKLCIAMGGRQVRTDPAYGMIYDHFAVDFEFTNGARFTSFCRQIEGCYARVGEQIMGTKGIAYAQSKIMPFEGEVWKYDGQAGNPYEWEHADLIASIRAGKPINEGKRGAESTLTAIMGRMSAYTGKLVTWKQAMDSKLDLTPKDLKFGPWPTAPVAMPGTDPLI